MNELRMAGNLTGELFHTYNRGIVFHDNLNIEVVNNLPKEDLNYIRDLYINGKLRDLKRLGRGANGSVYEYKEYAIKILHESDNYEESNDVRVLKDLQHLECIPTLYAVINDELLIMEKINGYTVERYCEYNEDNHLNIDEDFIEKWEKALLDIVKEGYSPDDLHGENVMIDSRTITPKIIDVGWFFKHDEDYDESDIDKMKSNYGYSRAQIWTGKTLKDYVYNMENGF